VADNDADGWTASCSTIRHATRSASRAADQRADDRAHDG